MLELFPFVPSPPTCIVLDLDSIGECLCSDEVNMLLPTKYTHTLFLGTHPENLPDLSICPAIAAKILATACLFNFDFLLTDQLDECRSSFAAIDS